ncbi:MAG: FtsX-like permease family protein [Cyanobacteria bacterium RI_101]|nr:FtsX-like permease family protein [Cyanobacteria bacterium RI_101]
MIDWQESAQMALRSLLGSKLRSALTMLGVAIGNGAVVALVAVGQGTQKATLEQFEALGPNVLFVRLTSARVRRAVSASARPLLLEDAEAIAANVPAIKAVAPEFHTTQLLSYGRQNLNAQVIGSTPDYLTVRKYRLSRGRFFNEGDIERNRRVMVLGAAMARRLFGETDPVGKTVRLQNQSFLVIGVLQSKGVLFGTDQDDQALAPLPLLSRQVAGRFFPYGIPLTLISLLARDETHLPTAQFQVTNLIRLLHPDARPDDIQITPQNGLLETTQTANQGLTQMLAAIASISLLVGGVGIMNIMLVSVTERTQEIGLRKALGARERDILSQFLIEAVILACVGGALGVGAAVAGVLAAESLALAPVSLSFSVIILSLGVSSAIGLGFGVLPAQRAARLDPIQALRSG